MLPVKRFYRPDEVAAFLGLSRRTVYRLLLWVNGQKRNPSCKVTNLDSKTNYSQGSGDWGMPRRR